MSKKYLREERTFELDGLEVRSDDGKPPRLVGHAAVYDKWSGDMGGFRERVRPGAFTKTLQEGDVRMTFNHNPDLIIGRQKPGTLALTDERTTGLHFEATPPDTSWANDMLTSIQRGDIDGCSFTFRTIKEEWGEKPDAADGLMRRSLIEVALPEVAIVSFPAYAQTDVKVRSIFADNGIDMEALQALLIRAERGIVPTQRDIELLNSSVAVLQSFVPSEPGNLAEAAGEAQAVLTDDAGEHHSDGEGERGAVQHFQTLLDLEMANA